MLEIFLKYCVQVVNIIEKYLKLHTVQLYGAVEFVKCSYTEEKDFHSYECINYNGKLQLIVRLEFWNLGNVEYPPIIITPSPL